MEKLPEELKLEILLRLSVRSLACLKCVSKSWRSIISNPNFDKMHLQLSTIYSQHPNRILLLTSAHRMRSIDINAPLHNDSATINHFFRPRESYNTVRIVASCRGIVLLLIDLKYLWMWNPVTRAYKQIPPPPECISPMPFAFCYDESDDNYFIGLSYHHKIRVFEVFEVLSLRTNSWEKLDLNHCFRTPFQNRGTIFNGAIHFMACTSRSPQLIAFHITTKVIKKVPPPICTNLECAELGVHKGCLTLIGEGEIHPKILVWVMEEDGVQSSWTMLFSISRDQCGIGCFLPSLFFKEGDEFVATYFTADGGEGLAKWNYKSELLLEHCVYHSNLLPWIPHSWGRAVAYTETLLPLP